MSSRAVPLENARRKCRARYPFHGKHHRLRHNAQDKEKQFWDLSRNKSFGSGHRARRCLHGLGKSSL
jgi:hypothetical protein